MRYEVFLVHADPGVRDGESFVAFVEFEVDARRGDAAAGEGFVSLVGEGEVAKLVKRIGGVGDQFTKEDFRVGVQGMNDQLKQLSNSDWNCCFDMRAGPDPELTAIPRIEMEQV